MRLLLVAVGIRMPGWVDAGFNEYAQRMPRELRLDLAEIRPEKRGAGRTREQLQQAEQGRIEAVLPLSCRLVALDERGSLHTTLQLAQRLEGWQADGRDVALLVGGADGLHDRLKDRADERWSLSPLTLPHGLVRVVVAEQLYRVCSVLKNHPYHREG